MALTDWSTTPINNSTKPGINWAEGQTPDSINNSARQMMADLAVLVGSGGADVLGLLSDLVDAVQTTIGASIKARRANAKSDFGAKFDGTTDDTLAIQKGINSLSAAGGGTLELPRGAAVVGTLSLPQDVYLEGQGKWATRLVAKAGLDAPVISRIGTYLSPINRGGVSSLTIVGSGKSFSGCVGIKNVYTNRGIFRDIDIHSTYRGMWIENVWQDFLDNVHVHGGGTQQNYIGFYFAPKAAITDVSNAVIAVGCMAQGVQQYGFRIENANGSKFTSCEASDGVHAWYLGDPSSGTEAFEFCHFVNCLGDTTSGHVWRLEKGAAAAIRKCQFANCWAGTSTAASAVYVANCSELVFSNWQIASMYLHGFHFYLSSRCMVTGCNIRDWNTPGAASNGIYLQDSSIIKIIGCDIYTITPGTGKGVVENAAGTSNYNFVFGCNLSTGTTLVGASSSAASNTTA